MSFSLRLNVFLLAAFLFVVAASLGMAYNTGSPAAGGHSSDEIDFVIETSTRDCSTSVSTGCTVACPVTSGGATYQYHVVSGGCISANALRVRQAGACNAPNCGAGIDNGWSCQDSSHVQNKLFVAYAHCLKGGQ